MDPDSNSLSGSPCGQRNSFFLDTRGLCFMCLKITQPIKSDADRDPLGDSVEEDYCTFSPFSSVSKICSFQAVSRYLDINFDKVFQTSVPLQSPESLARSELFVSVCESCSVEVERFSNLFQELELIKMRLTGCVQTIRDRVVNGGNDWWLMGEFRKRMKTSDHSDILQAEIIENLRQETVEKCSSLIQKAQPRVEVHRLANPKSPMMMTSPHSHSDDFDSDDDDEGNDQTLLPTSEIENQNCSSENFTISGNEKREKNDDKGVPKRSVNRNGPRANPWPVQPHRCKYCSRTFANSCKLGGHTVTQHFEQSFLPLKDPNLPTELFKAAVDLILIKDQVIQELPEAEQKEKATSMKRRYFCPHCQQPYIRKNSLRLHIIQVHYNEVRLKLLEIQNNPDLSTLSEHAKHLAANKAQKEKVDDIGINKEIIKSTGLKAGGVDACLLLGKKQSLNRVKRPPEIFTTTCSSCELTLPTRADWIKHTRLECKGNKFISSSSRTSVNSVKPNNSKSFWNRTPPAPRLKCNVCRKKFRDHYTMNKHKSIQHPPDSSSVDFQCEHCIKKFRFFFAYRIHLLTIHRLEVFVGFAPPGTKYKVVHDSLNTILQIYTKIPDGEKQSALHACNLCPKTFTQSFELENHIVVAHFDEVVVHLIEFLGGNDSDNDKLSAAAETENPRRDEMHNPPEEQEMNIDDNGDSMDGKVEKGDTFDANYDIKMEEIVAITGDAQLNCDNNNKFEDPLDPFSIL